MWTNTLRSVDRRGDGEVYAIVDLTDGVETVSREWKLPASATDGWLEGAVDEVAKTLGTREAYIETLKLSVSKTLPAPAPEPIE